MDSETQETKVFVELFHVFFFLLEWCYGGFRYLTVLVGQTEDAVPQAQN